MLSLNAKNITEPIYQKAYLIDPLADGSSPVDAFAAPPGGIPVIFAGVGYDDNRAHSPDEHVRLSDFLNGARHIAYILNGFTDLSGAK
jgi:acetylornithine deacetylase/succinyl-diaminopimelate desuccinylase-like protein